LAGPHRLEPIYKRRQVNAEDCLYMYAQLVKLEVVRAAHNWAFCYDMPTLLGRLDHR